LISYVCEAVVAEWAAAGHYALSARALRRQERTGWRGVSDTDPTSETTPDGSEPGRAEIRAFLIADVRGYTRFTHERGDEAAASLAARFAAIVRDVVESRGGQLLELRGDEALVVFSSSRFAIRTAVDLQLRFVAETKNDPSLALPVGIGIDAGEVVPVEGGYRGGALNLAARLCSQAGPGEILATREVVHLARKIDGIRYADRGRMQLKGMAEPVRAVIVRPEDSDPAAEMIALGRPSSPLVRRNKIATVALLLALVAVIVALAALRSATGSTGHRAIGADSAGAIDLRSDSIGAQLSLGSQPNQIAAGFGALWVTNSEDGTVSRIDPNARTVVQRITVGSDPTGITTGAGAVWVANSDSRTVARINPGTSTVVQSIQVGNGPTGVAVSPSAIWVANSLDDTVTKIDPESGKVIAIIPVGGTPTALAVGFDSVWVTNATEGTVSRIDLSTNRVSGPFRVGNGPHGIVATTDGVWVSNSLDGTVARLDPNTGSVTAAVKVGAGAGTIVAANGVLWVADEDAGRISRVDPGSGSAKTIMTGSAPAGVVALDGSLWTTTRGAPTSHRGGTLTLVSTRQRRIDTIDPANVGNTYQLLSFVYDGLVGYKRVGGVDGSTLLPDLAVSIPSPAENGTVYTFQLRKGIQYSDGTPVLAQDVRHSIQRMLAFGGGEIAGPTLQSVIGAPACVRRPATCDLSRGVVIDNAAGTVTFHLSHPDPEFVFQLAAPGTQIVPSSTPLRDVGTRPAPGTGPYMIGSFVAGKRLELIRNPRFTPESPAQPAGYPDRIVWTANVSTDEGMSAVEQGKADYFYDDIPVPALGQIETQYTQLAHVFPYLGPWSLYLNTRVPPFDDVRVRRALAYAIDRNEVAKRYPLRAVVSCQGLVPNFSGYRPYCPYTLAPNAAGTWTAPNLTKARSLVNQSGSKGTPVTLSTYVDFKGVSEYVASVLRNLGYPTTVKVFDDFGKFYKYVGDSRNKAQLSGYWNVPDHPSPSELIGGFSCDSFIPDDATGSNVTTSEFCDPSVDRLIAAAHANQYGDPAAAAALWTKVDHALVDKAPLIPLVIPQNVDLVSPRVRNYENNPAWGMLLDQVWIQ
jgi:YVTN family beta-propeller protein